MEGYKNFYEDVSVAFKEVLASTQLSVRNLPKSSQPYRVILESESQYVSLGVEQLSVIFMLVDKKSRKFIFGDEFLSLLGIDFKEQKKKHFDAIYEELYNITSLSVPEQTNILVQHICLGELYTYAKLIETDLYKFVFDIKESWVDLAEKNGVKLYETKAFDFSS
jgi:hypothetical protein